MFLKSEEKNWLKKTLHAEADKLVLKENKYFFLFEENIDFHSRRGPLPTTPPRSASSPNKNH